MVAVKFPVRGATVLPSQLRVMFKQALEYKRDQIAHIQSKPPFNDAEHRRYNAAYSRIFGAIAHTGKALDHAETLALALGDEQLSECERDLIRQLAGLHADGAEPVQSYVYNQQKSDWDDVVVEPQQGVGRPPIAPRLVKQFMENAELDDTHVHRKVALSVTAAAYGQACFDANHRLGASTDDSKFVVPITLQAQMGLKAEQDLPERDAEGDRSAAHDEVVAPTLCQGTGMNGSPSSPTINAHARPPVHGSAIQQQAASPAPAISPSTVDLRISELCSRAIAEYRRTDTWADSAQRNARVITDIFIAENGDRRVSEITRNHLLALDARLKKLPQVWGKSREDRQGGLRHVFHRGEILAAAWATDKIKAEREKLPKVGLSAGTYNRHIKTLKQVLDFVEVIAEIDQGQVYARANVSFTRLHEVDGRRKNKRKPVPVASELHTLVSGPLHTGCANMDNRFSPGPVVIHDGPYWMPLLLAVYGARSNEFCQMPLANANVDAPEPYFRIRQSIHQTTKTAPSDRDLPIAPKLLQLGFANYVRALRARGEFWLFPEFNTTKVPARKRFREMVFSPLLDHHFPNGTSNAFPDKDIDTQSLRKFAATYLRQQKPKIELGVRQSFFGHAKMTTLEENYEDDHTLDELMPCVLRMEELIAHLKPFPLRLTQS